MVDFLREFFILTTHSYLCIISVKAALLVSLIYHQFSVRLYVDLVSVHVFVMPAVLHMQHVSRTVSYTFLSELPVFLLSFISCLFMFLDVVAVHTADVDNVTGQCRVVISVHMLVYYFLPLLKATWSFVAFFIAKSCYTV